MAGRAGFGIHGEFRDVGYTVGRQHWGRGLGTELAAALRDWHWQHPDPDRPDVLSAFTAEENHASRRILEKVGFWLVDAQSSAKIHPGQNGRCLSWLAAANDYGRTPKV